MACNCIEEVSKTTLDHLTKKSEEDGATVMEIQTWDGDGMQNTTYCLSDSQISGEVLKTEFVYRTTFIKKDKSTSRPQKNRCSLIFTFCPFCGIKYIPDVPETKE